MTAQLSWHVQNFVVIAQELVSEISFTCEKFPLNLNDSGKLLVEWSHVIMVTFLIHNKTQVCLPFKTGRGQLTLLVPGGNYKILLIPYWNDFSWLKIFKFWYCSSRIFFRKKPIDDMSELVWVMVWCWVSIKQLPEPMMTKIYDIWYHWAIMS